MKLFSKIVILFVILSLVTTSDAVAIGFSCKYLLQNSVKAAVDGYKTVRRNMRPARLFYKNLDTEKIDRIVKKYRGNSGAIRSFEADLRERASNGDGQFTPEEFFALDILRRPTESRELIEQVTKNNFVWVRKRFGFQDRLTKDPAAVDWVRSDFTKQFKFPSKVAEKDFEYTVLSLVVAVAQANFENPSDFKIFAGPWKGFYEPLIDAWAKRDYPELFSSTAFRNLAMTLAENLFNQEANRDAWLIDFKNHLDHPENLRNRLADISPEAKLVYEKSGKAALLNYLINHGGVKRATFWFGRMLMFSLGAFFGAQTIMNHFKKNALNLRKGQGLSTADPNAAQETMCDFTIEDDNIENLTFDPVDPYLIGAPNFALSNPLSTLPFSKCDPDHRVASEYVAIRKSENEADFFSSPKRVATFNRWRQMILTYWNDEASGCKQFYHDELKSARRCVETTVESPDKTLPQTIKSSVDSE